jgi:hypothetical protein
MDGCKPGCKSRSLAVTASRSIVRRETSVWDKTANVQGLCQCGRYIASHLLSLLTLPLGMGLMTKFYKKDMAVLEEETAQMHLPFGILMLNGILSTSQGFLAFL